MKVLDLPFKNVDVFNEKEFNVRREEIKDVLQKYEYGYIPEAPVGFTVDHKEDEIEKYRFAGKATSFGLVFNATLKNGRKISFPFRMTVPTKNAGKKTLIAIQFQSEVPNRYYPTEEIIDRGYTVASFNYSEVISDDGDFDNGVASGFDFQKEYAPGKIAIWAWATMRIVDYCYTLDYVNKENIGVCGHSRLGKVALLAGAFDERIKFVHSNDSGCCGAGLFAMKNDDSENIKDIVGRFPFWFTPSFGDYIDKEDLLPFDQHYLTSLIYPRALSVHSATRDTWANPKAEQKALELAEEVYKAGGVSGKTDYYLREGSHYFSREDWNKMLDFFDKNIK